MKTIASHKMSWTFFPCSMSLIIEFRFLSANLSTNTSWPRVNPNGCGKAHGAHGTHGAQSAWCPSLRSLRPEGSPRHSPNKPSNLQDFSVYFAKWPKLERKVSRNHCRFAYEHLGQRNGRYLVLEFKKRVVFFSCVSLFHAFSHCLWEYCWHIHAIDT